MYINSRYQKKSLVKSLQKLWHDSYHNISLIVGSYGIIALFVIMFTAPWIAPFPVEVDHFTTPLLPPAWSILGDIDYFFGTDDLGRDILSRLIYGLQPSLGSSLVIMLLVSLAGGFVGILAGINHGFRAAFLIHIFDIFLSIPLLLMTLAVVIFIGPSLYSVMLAVGLCLLPQTVRVISQAVHSELEKDYVTAIRLDGATTGYILKNAILPNITPEIISVCRQNWAASLLSISTLSFLGLGAQSPSCEWGALLYESLDMVYVSPWVVIFPGLAILITVLLIHLFGRGIEQLLSRQG